MKTREHPAANRPDRSRVELRWVVGFAAGVVAILVAVVLCVQVVLDTLERWKPIPELPPAAVMPRELPPEPRLQVAPRRELQELRSREDELLNSYGWVDREAGVVRIPVERAIDLLADRGLPVRRPTREAAGGRQP